MTRICAADDVHCVWETRPAVAEEQEMSAGTGVFAAASAASVQPCTLVQAELGDGKAAETGAINRSRHDRRRNVPNLAAIDTLAGGKQSAFRLNSPRPTPRNSIFSQQPMSGRGLISGDTTPRSSTHPICLVS